MYKNIYIDDRYNGNKQNLQNPHLKYIMNSYKLICKKRKQKS